MRCRRPDSSSVSRFHEALHAGQVDTARRLLFRDASLANARSSTSPHVTSLMVSATSPLAPLKTIQTLVKMLLAKGASLRTKDAHRRHVLMAICVSGAHPSVLQSLLDGDQTSHLLWSDRDDQGRTAVGLACLHGHGRLASYILDILSPEEEKEGNSPLHALNFALSSGDERCVLELLHNRKVQRVIRNNRRVDKLTAHGEWIQSQQAHGEDQVSVFSCVEAAVEKEMVRAVQAMHRLNRRGVGHATWFALCKEVETCRRGKAVVVRRPAQVRPEFDEIADLHRRDCVWGRMQLVFLIRYAPDRLRKQQTARNIVAELPDVVFRIVAEFLRPKFNDAEEAQKERFKTVLDLSSW